MGTYTQLTQAQRYGIALLLKTPTTSTAIAQAMGVHKSTVSREVRRNRSPRGSRQQQAHRLAVDRRDRLGDWELDTIVGARHHQVVVTLTERASRLTRMQHVPQRTAAIVAHAIQDQWGPLHDMGRPLTADHGQECADHGTIATRLGARFYFAYAYAAWERGTNENTNGLIRQYLSKGSAFTDLQAAEIHRITDRLNNRPQKCSNYRTPNEVFFGNMSPVALAS